jgi:hypothetical protein
LVDVALLRINDSPLTVDDDGQAFAGTVVFSHQTATRLLADAQAAIASITASR